MGDRGRIDGIQPFAELHEGRTTTVYKAYQEALDRFVLLKVLKAPYSRDAERVRRFEEEARLVAQIQHPNVVTIHDYGRTRDERAYLAAEFVEGSDLRALLDDGPLPPELATFVLLQAARGLQAAHERGILHRDLKPANVLIAQNGQVKLTDFGMASLSGEEDEEVRGTPAYLAPEYVAGASPSEAGDLFALGALLYEMLVGRRAFVGSSTGEVLDALRHHDPLPVLERQTQLPEALSEVATQLLAKEPSERYASASALVQALSEVRRQMGWRAAQPALRAFLEDPEAYRERASKTTPTGNKEQKEEPVPAASEGSSPSRPRRLTWIALGTLVVVGTVLAGLIMLDSADQNQRASSDQPVIDSSMAAGSTFVAQKTRTSADSIETSSPESDTTETSSLPEEPRSSQSASPASPPPDDTASDDTTSSAPALAGTLQVRVSPWADVYVNGDSLGQAPPEQQVTLEPGSYQLRFENDTFPESYFKKVHVAPGEKRLVKMKLFQHVGRVTINVRPWAEVYIDGVKRDTLDHSTRKQFIVAPGEHTLILRHPELGARETRFHVEAGAQRRLTYNLRQ